MNKPSVEELVAAFCARTKEEESEKIREKQEQSKIEAQEKAERWALVESLQADAVRIFKPLTDLHLVEVVPTRRKGNGDVEFSIIQLQDQVLENNDLGQIGAYYDRREQRWTYYGYGLAEFKYPNGHTVSRDEVIVRLCQCAGKALARYQLGIAEQ